MRSSEWNERMRSLECWVCGSTVSGAAPVSAIVGWVSEHEHTRIEREAARIVELARRKAEKRGPERRN